jgi:hypothetical protein
MGLRSRHGATLAPTVRLCQHSCMTMCCLLIRGVWEGGFATSVPAAGTVPVRVWLRSACVVECKSHPCCGSNNPCHSGDTHAHWW